MNQDLDALVFDAYGTIFDVHSVVGACEACFPGRGKALSALWRSKQLEYTWLRSLMQRHADFDQVTAEALSFACQALGLAANAEALRELPQAYTTLMPFADSLAGLRALRGGKRLAILSNGTPASLNAVVTHAGLNTTFEQVLSIEEAGIFKPDRRVYRLAVDRLELERERIGFVSSNGWDAAGAKAFGFTVFWVNRTGNPVEALGVYPDYIVAGVDEVARLVGG
ncbi:MAG TPA: haloacid dehalogenase type II [Usitatibacteraceae bacterium]